MQKNKFVLFFMILSIIISFCAGYFYKSQEIIFSEKETQNIYITNPSNDISIYGELNNLNIFVNGEKIGD